jgi:hypothetical protein
MVRPGATGTHSATLVLPTLHTSSEQARINELVTTFDQLDDPHLIATVHSYGYRPFSVNVAGGTRFDAATQQDLTDSFDRVHNAFVARGIPVIIGEYGLLGLDRHTGTIQQGEKLKFFEFLGHYARRSTTGRRSRSPSTSGVARQSPTGSPSPAAPSPAPPPDGTRATRRSPIRLPDRLTAASLLDQLRARPAVRGRQKLPPNPPP